MTILIRLLLITLVWILGLRPTAGQGGGLKAGKSSSETSAVITTAVMADLPVLAKVGVPYEKIYLYFRMIVSELQVPSTGTA
jgi:hypothetical protein